MKIFTIGFTQKSAEEFFGLLKSNGVQCVIDITPPRDDTWMGSGYGDLRASLL